jgi:MFS family permease
MAATATARLPRARGLGGMGPFLFAAAAMYSTQAILPALGREFSVTPSQTGLTVSVVIGALAVGAWFWGPLSDRIGRRASLALASAMYFSSYYVAGALGAYVPGLAWESSHWTGVWALTLTAYAVGLAAIIPTALVVHPRGRG